jgi:hypothetical protein
VSLPRLRLSRRASVVAAAVVSSLLLGSAHAAAPGPPVPAVPIATLAVTDCSANAQRVPADYLGLSIEWSMVAHWFGTSRAGAVEPTAALLRSLQSSPETPGVLRIGGNSQDGYAWRPDAPVTGNALFRGTISRGMIDALFEVANRSGWKVILGLNLRSDRPDEAVALTRYAMSQDTQHRLIAVELGNEPTVYFGADATAYIARIYSYVQALDADPVTRQVLIAGPSLANGTDLEFLARLRAAYASRLPFLTWHHYANRPTLSGLLSESVSNDWTDRLSQVTRAAGSTPTRMDEGNSVGHGGMNRVSNVMGSTAWLVDAMLTGAQQGLAGYNVHAWDGYYYPAEHRESYYTPFVVRGGVVLPRPPLYALALLRDAPGKRFCKSTVAVAAGESVKGWTLVDPASNDLFVYVVEKGGPGHSGDIAIAAPTGYGGVAAVSRITDAGGCEGRRTSIDDSRVPTSGDFSRTPETVRPAATTSAYLVHLDSCETALIKISPGGMLPSSGTVPGRGQ